MFEKDAEKYRLNLVLQLREKTLQGYDCQLSKLRDLSDIEVAFQKGAELGYDTANKWHFIKDDDLPEENKLCLLYLGNNFNPITGWYKCGYWYFEDCRNVNLWQEKVIAWKEVVLPKE